MTTGIYSITNKINGKLYIGHATNFVRRWCTHKKDLSNGNHHCDHLQRAWNIHGKENFKFERIEVCSVELLKKQEHYWAILLKVHDPEYGYNIAPTDPDGLVRMSEETKEKLRVLARQRKHTPETIEKIRKASTGRKQTSESIEKSASKRRGKPANLNMINAAADWHRGKKLSIETIEKREVTRKANAEKRGYYFTQESIDKRVEKFKGYKHSEETIKKISANSKLHRHSEETKRKMSESRKGKPRNSKK